MLPERWQEAVKYAELAYNLAPGRCDGPFPPDLGIAVGSLVLTMPNRTADAAITANPESALPQLAQASAAFKSV